MLSFSIGYDSDDECEDADGIRYTRRNKGKKYAPLQKDDSLEMGQYGGSTGTQHHHPHNQRHHGVQQQQQDRRHGGHDLPRANGHSLSHAVSNGSVCNHHNSSAFPHYTGDGEVHLQRPHDTPLSSEESSDVEANLGSYTRPPIAGIVGPLFDAI